MTELCDLAATDLRRMIGTKAISARELLASCEERIRATNGHLNAIVAMRLDEARAEAAAADEAIARGDRLGLLHGLPVTIKESNDVAGMLTTTGSPLFADRRAAKDDSMVASVRASGAIIVGKTNVPELLHGMTSSNTIYGLTRNAFDPELSCNGSSGGAGVAMSVSMTPIATGSDTGGSIRGPAATNGVYGLRPTSGLVGRDDTGHVFNPSSVLGPMARSADDLALLLAAMIHDNPRDPFRWSPPADAILRRPPADLSSLRVAISPDLGCVDIDDPIRASFLAKVETIAPLFGRVTHASPDLGQIVKAFWLLRPLKFMAAMGEAYKRDPRSMTEYKRKDFRRGFASTTEQIVWAMAEQTRAFRSMVAFFEDVDVLITPGWATLPLSLAEIARREAAMKADNEAHGPFEHDFSKEEPSRSINPPITLTAHPVLTMPAGLGPTGQPFGLNLIGPYRGDLGLVAIARALEPIFAADPALRRPVPDIAAIAAQSKEHHQ